MRHQLASSATERQELSRSRSASSAQEFRILLIESDATTRRRYAEALIAVPPGPGIAYRIITVGSAGAAQLQAARQRFHLIIAPLRGRHSDEELVERISELYRSDIKLLLLRDQSTSETNLELVKRLRATLVDHSIDDSELRGVVAMVLGLATTYHPTAPEVATPAEEAQQRAIATLPDIQLLLDVLRHESHATLALFADNIGHIIAQRGDDTDIDVPVLASLIAGSFINSVELGRMLQDADTLHISVHEGRAYDVYSANVGHDRVLVLLFDKERSRPRHGYVWLVMKRGAEQLQRMKTSQSAAHVDEAMSRQLTDSIIDEFDRLFGGELNDR